MAETASAQPGTEGPAAPRVRRVPAWASVGIVVACLGAAGWMGWKFWAKPAAGSRVEVLPRNPDDHVERNIRNNNEWTIVGGLGEVTVTRPAADQPATLRFAFRESQQFLTPEEAKALKGAQLVLEKNSAVESMGVKQEQIKPLEARWATRFDIQKLEPSDERDIRELFDAYEPLEKAVDAARVAAVEAKDGPPDPARRRAADEDLVRKEAAKRAAETRLCDAVEAVVRRKVPPYRKDATERAALVRSILTAEQQKQLDEATLPGLGGRRGRGR